MITFAHSYREKGTPQYIHIESGNQAWQTCASQPYPFASLASALGVDGWKECTYCAMEGAEKIRLICLQTRNSEKPPRGKGGVLDKKKIPWPVAPKLFFETWANFSNERDAEIVVLKNEKVFLKKLNRSSVCTTHLVMFNFVTFDSVPPKMRERNSHFTINKGQAVKVLKKKTSLLNVFTKTTLPSKKKQAPTKTPNF